MFKRNKAWPIVSAAMLLALIAGGGRSAAQINQPSQPVPIGWQVIAGLLPSDVTLNSVYIPRTVDTPPGAFVAGNDGVGHGLVYVLRQSGFGGPWSSALEQSFPAPLRALVWLNGANIWAVGDGGLIAHRDGSGWHQVSSPVAGANLHAIQMFGNGDEGWAAGSVLDTTTKQPQPTLLHYKNGQWQQDNSISGSGDITSLSFSDSNNGWLVGSVGIWHYQNGAWRNETTPAPCISGCTADLNAVSAISSDEAWAVGNHSGTCNGCIMQPYALHRINGSWQAVLPDTPIAGTNPVTDTYTDARLSAVHFSAANFGLAVGSNAHSTTRTSPSRPTPLALRYQSGAWKYDVLPVNIGMLNAVYVAGPNAALAVGAAGLILSYGYGNSVLPTPIGTTPATRVPDPHDPNVTYFNQTGHTLRGAFRDYWQAHGGLAQFGYPITEQFVEGSGAITSYMVQYFERNRFELHPENQPPNNVLLGLLGRTVTAGREGELPFQRTPAMMNPSAIYFDTTGHNLSGLFHTYWQEHGGLAIYGYPISEQFTEVSKTDGKSYTVQYFERNRFEYHPELPDPYKVSLGLLGVQVLQQRGWLP
jgi:hypothetical protein